MPKPSASYNWMYRLSGFDPASGAYGDTDGFSTTYTIQDGDEDGKLQVDDQATIHSSAGIIASARYTGYTVNDGPVLLLSEKYFVFTATPISGSGGTATPTPTFTL